MPGLVRSTMTLETTYQKSRLSFRPHFLPEETQKNLPIGREAKVNRLRANG